MVVIWTKKAAESLEKIIGFIRLDSSHYADKVKEDIIKITDYLGIYPQSGRKVPETKREDIREVFAYSYRIVYKITEKNIYILRLFNMRQNRHWTDFFI